MQPLLRVSAALTEGLRVQTVWQPDTQRLHARHLGCLAHGEYLLGVGPAGHTFWMTMTAVGH